MRVELLIPRIPTYSYMLPSLVEPLSKMQDGGRWKVMIAKITLLQDISSAIFQIAIDSYDSKRYIC